MMEGLFFQNIQRRRFRYAVGPALVFFLSAFFSGMPTALPEETAKVVDVIGSQSMRSSNMAEAREKAIAGCLVSAVAAAVEDLVPLSSQVDNFRVFNEALYNRTGDFVQGYKVLAEFVNDANYRLILQATVSVDNIVRALEAAGVATRKATLPRVLFFVSEKTVADILPRYWWGEDPVFVVPSAEEGMAESLQKNGFDVINHTQFVDPLNLSLNLSPEEAVSIGNRLLAGVVIIGQASAEQATNVMGQELKSYKASVSVKAFDVESGGELAFASRSAVAADADPVAGCRQALYEAGKMAGAAVAQQITAAIRQLDAQKGSIDIIVDGTGELINFVQFRRALRQISGVTALHIKEMKADTSTIEVEYEGASKSLAEALLLKTFDAFGIDIYDVTPDTLRVELVTE